MVSAPAPAILLPEVQESLRTLPKTGDNSHWYLISTILSAIALFFVVLTDKSKTENTSMKQDSIRPTSNDVNIKDSALIDVISKMKDKAYPDVGKKLFDIRKHCNLCSIKRGP